jgi:hypothetical protein
MSKEKVLWVVHYAQLDAFLAKAVDIGASGVAIRTDNHDVAAAIPKFHAKGIKVYGWRWPAAVEASAMDEAARVVALLGKGLDGYYVDPEANKKQALNWDRPGLAGLAEKFCTAITAAAPGKEFGFTSHYLAKKAEPQLPWGAFFNHATVLLPQAYWRSDEGIIGHGIPGDNYAVSIDAWKKAGGDKAKIVPMAGELGSSTANEIKAYAAAAAKAGIDRLHFYAYEESVKDSVWQAVKDA